MTAEVLEEGHPAIENTPRFLGYVLAVLISWVLASLGMTVGLWILGEGSGDRFGTWWDLQVMAELSFLVVTSAAILAGPIGVVLVDLACDRFPQQWVHVLAAAVGVALCAAAGRAAVIPVVPAVRRRRAAKQSTA